MFQPFLTTPGLTIDATAANLVPSNQATTAQLNTGASARIGTVLAAGRRERFPREGPIYYRDANGERLRREQRSHPVTRVVGQVAAAPPTTYGVQQSAPSVTTPQRSFSSITFGGVTHSHGF